MIIPARNAREQLPRALDSVFAQTYSNIIDVVVADADDSAAGLANPKVVVLPNPAGTTPAGLNLAIAASTGEVVVRCDAQSSLPEDYVEKAVDVLENTGAANVGGMQVPIGETAWERAIAAAMSSPWGAGDARYRIGGAAGAAETVYLGVFRRDALEEVGGFDEDFTRTQDYELNHRLIRNGGVVWFDPALRVTYRPRPSLRPLAQQYLEYGRAKRRFSGKHRGFLRWRQMAAPILVVVLGSSLVFSLWWPMALIVPGMYALGLIGAGISSAESSWRVATALATMHLSWGWGFLTDVSR